MHLYLFLQSEPPAFIRQDKFFKESILKIRNQKHIVTQSIIRE